MSIRMFLAVPVGWWRALEGFAPFYAIADMCGRGANHLVDCYQNLINYQHAWDKVENETWAIGGHRFGPHSRLNNHRNGKLPMVAGKEQLAVGREQQEVDRY